MLTGQTSTRVETRAQFYAVSPRRGNDRMRFRVDSWSHDDKMTLWHEHGRGSSSSVGSVGEIKSVAVAVELGRRHAAEAEDPCETYGSMWVLGDDLGATIHLFSYGHESRCGRTLKTRVLRSSVTDTDRICGTCSRSW
jgi:hypothetical protein